jgi:hypothetical protein
MNQECNNLIEQYNVVKRTGRMIYGEDLMDRAFSKQDKPQEERKGNSSDELIAEFRPKGCKLCFNRSNNFVSTICNSLKQRSKGCLWQRGRHLNRLHGGHD